MIIKLIKRSRNTLIGAWQVIEYLRIEIRPKMEISFLLFTNVEYFQYVNIIVFFLQTYFHGFNGWINLLRK